MKKFLLVAVCFAMALSSCIKDETSASVDRIYDAYAQKLSAEAALTQAEADALAVLTEAEAALMAAQTESVKIWNQILDIQRQLAEVELEYAKAELELKLAELEAKLVELQATMEKAAVDAEAALLKAQTALNKAQEEFIESVKNLEAAEAARLVGLFNAYTKAVEKLIEAKTAVTTKTAELAAVENKLVEAEEYRDEVLAQIDEKIAYCQHEIAMTEKAIEIFTKYQTVTVEEAEAALEPVLVDLQDLSVAATLAAEASNKAAEKFSVEYYDVAFEHKFHTTLKSNPLDFDDVKVIDNIAWYGFYTESKDSAAVEEIFTPVYVSYDKESDHYNYVTDEYVYVEYPFFAENGKIEYTTSASLLPLTEEYEVLASLGQYSKEGLEAYIAYMESLAAEYPGFDVNELYTWEAEVFKYYELYYEALSKLSNGEFSSEDEYNELMNQYNEYSYLYYETLDKYGLYNAFIDYLYAVRMLPEAKAALPLLETLVAKIAAWNDAQIAYDALVGTTTLPEDLSMIDMMPLPEELSNNLAWVVYRLDKLINGYEARRYDPMEGFVNEFVPGLTQIADAAKTAYEEAVEVTKKADEEQKAAKKDLDAAKKAVADAGAKVTDAQKTAVEEAQKAYDKAVAAYNDAVQKEKWAKEDQELAKANLKAANDELDAAQKALDAAIAQIPAAWDAVEVAKRDAVYYFAQNEAAMGVEDGDAFNSANMDASDDSKNSLISAKFLYGYMLEAIKEYENNIADYEAAAPDYMNAAENIKVAEQLIKDLEILEADAVKFVEEYNAASKAAAEAYVAHVTAADAQMLKEVEVEALNITLSDAEMMADAIESYNEDIERYNKDIKALEADKVKAANLATYEDAVEFAKMRLEAAEAEVEFYTARAEAAEAAWKDAE